MASALSAIACSAILGLSFLRGTDAMMLHAPKPTDQQIEHSFFVPRQTTLLAQTNSTPSLTLPSYLQTLVDMFSQEGVSAEPNPTSWLVGAKLGKRLQYGLLFGGLCLLSMVDIVCWRDSPAKAHPPERNLADTERANSNSANSRRRHTSRLVFWIIVAILFNIAVSTCGGGKLGELWFIGYGLEWLLSMDNLFVFHLIFSTFSTPKRIVDRALFFGILCAVVLRLVFFSLASFLLGVSGSVRYVLGAVIIYSGIQAARDEDDDQTDFSNSIVVRMLRWAGGSRMLDRYDEHHFFVVEQGQTRATLLLPLVVLLAFTDVVFAMDSVSAKVAQIPDFFINYSSSVLAMMGLRAMFFIIQDLVDCFDKLKYGLCFILVFIGVELLVSEFVKLPPHAVLCVILSVFTVCICLSSGKQIERAESAL
eukprot:TRINITY_DN10854_c0_g2_i1.p1 TRINITY_DN10854_c0_g2~~TRINITY_DN10854_c0_g2_i1.p1  ORF type:complete len:446 (+),score=69.41 TRINITY_DN10854_c0_g2_i1:74-1339(+)